MNSLKFGNSIHDENELFNNLTKLLDYRIKKYVDAVLPDDDAYDMLCREALKEADIIANATDRMDNKSWIVALYGMV